MSEIEVQAMRDQRQLVRLALSKLTTRYERKVIDMRQDYESERSRLEAML